MKRVLVTGSSGLLGYAVRQVVAKSPHKYKFSTRNDADLESAKQTTQLIEQAQPDAILHLAAVVGGIKYNMEKPEELRDKNRRINENVLGAADKLGVPKVISILSTCIFPNEAPEPWGEKLIHGGKVDDRQWGYAQAKRELDLMSRDITSKSHGKKAYVCLMPSTLYGENDNYDPEKSHVLPAVIQKIHQAKLGGSEAVFWGTGKPRREFTYARDMALILLWALDNYDDSEPMIIAPSSDVSVKELVDAVTELLEFKGSVRWDRSHPDGRFTRKTNITKFQKLLPEFELTPFEMGLKAMVEDYLRMFPNVRGLGQRVEATS